MAKEVDVQVRYIPDTSALKNALSGTQNIDFKIGGSGLKKELLTPVQNAMKEVNKALASGADNKTLLKLFQDVGKAADSAKLKATGMLTEINSGFNSAGNQKLLKDLEQYQKELDKVEKKIANWDSKYGNKRMSQMKSDLGVGGIADAKKELEEQLKVEGKLTKETQARVDALKEYIDTWNKRKELADNGVTKGSMESDASVLRGKISDIMKTVELPQSNVEWTKQLTPIINALGQAAGLSTQEINKLTNAINNEDKAAKAAIDENKKEALRLADVVTGTFLGTNISSLFTSALRRGVEFFKEYDETLTRTMMVTGMTRDEVNNLTSSYNKLANQLSSTTKDVAAAQLVFYQQGLGTSEALKMTEASIAISKTGGIEAGEAANRLTAAIRGYKMAANDAMSIADKMSALDAAAASSVDELTIAMQKSASQARMAGLDLDYYMAYLSTMQEVTREAPENIGTAMKSITSRLQEITDLGAVEEDGTTFSNVAKALNSVGIAAVDSSGQLRQLQEIMNELGPMWATLDKNHKAYLATTLAGNRQQSRFIALMDNYDRAMELVSVSQNASGESAKQLRAYNQGLEASFTRLSNAWQQFATKIANSDTIKGVIDLLADFVEVLNKIPKPITQTVIPLLALSKGFQLFKNAGSLFNEFKGAISKKLGIDSLTKDTNTLNKTMNSSINIFSRFGTAIKKAFDGFGNNKYLDEYNKSLQIANEQIDINTIKTTTNSGVKNAELGSSSKLTTASNVLTNSYNLLNAAIERNEKVLQANDDEMLLEANDDYRVAKTNLEATNNQMSNKQTEMTRNYNDADKKIQNAFKSHESKAETQVQRRVTNYLKEVKGIDTSKLSNSDIKKYVATLQNEADEYDLTKVEEFARKVQADADKNAERILEDFNELEETQKELLQKIAEYRKGAGLPYSMDSINIPQSPLEKFKEQQTASISDIRNLFGDKSIGNIDKLSALFGKLNLSSGLVAGSLTKMGASFLGLDDDMSSALSTSVGMATTLGKFAPPWGAIIGASIGVIQFAFDKMWPSVEKTKQKLVELQEEEDSITQKRNNIKSSLEVYERLSGKLDKTDEETQQLKDSTEELVKLVPGAITGYNKYGEAVLNTAAAYAELDKQQRELSANADAQLEQFDNLQKGAQKTAKTWNTINKVIGWTLTIGGTILAPFTGGTSLYGTAAGLAMIGGGAIADEVIDEKQLEENRKVWDENYSEILSAYQTKRNEFVQDIADENKDTATKIVDSFITSIMDAGRDGRITNATEAINNLLSNFENVSFGDIDKAIKSLNEVGKYIDGMSFKKARELLEKELKSSLEAAGLDNVQIEGIITATLNIAWDGAAEVEALKTEIDKEISNLQNGGGDQSKIPYLESFKKGLDELNQEELTLLKNAGMLDTSFAEVFGKNGGLKYVLNNFKNSNGELNKSRAIISTINTLLEEQEGQQNKITEYEEKNKTEQENYYKTLKEVAKEEAKGFSFRNDDEKNEWIEKRYNRLKGIDWNDENDGITFESEVTSGQQNKVRNAWNQYNSAIESNNKIIKESKSNIKDYENNITDLISKIESYAVPTFNELSDEIKKMKESWDAFLGLADHLDNTSGMLDVDGITQLFDLLGSFEGVAFETQEQFDAWMHAIEGINNGLSMENGELQLNAEAMSSVNDLVSYSTRLKANDMLMTIERGKAELQNQKEVLEAQKEAVDAEILKIEKMDDAEYKSLVENGQLQKDFKADYIKLLDQTNMHEIEGEDNKLTTMLQMENNYFKQIAAMRTAYAKGEDVGDVKWMDIKGEYSKVYDKFVNESADTFSNLITKDKEATLASLREYSAGLGQQISNLDQRIENEVKLKETIAKYLNDENTNLSKAFGDNAQKDVSDYNEKLERTLTLLEKIEGLQHKIDENENFKDLYKDYSGEDYGRLLMTNLSIAQEQYDVYKDLFAMQQEMTNQAAGDLLDSPYGQMFKIMENGDIGWADASMYDKYKNLPNDMQEDIDNLVDAFQNQRNALRDTEKDLVKYAQEVKKVREELVETEITIENWLVDALKNREKIMNDARQKALDDEIKMIETAVEARKKANDRESQNKELYKAQEALRRATLDSSGKNNAQLLQLQQDLEDKQLDIAEKRFEDDMDDRKQWLQDTKDAEQETYDYRLETMTWYWEQVQMIQEQGTEAMMETLIHWNEEYNTQSRLQQEEMEREWFNTMEAMRKATDMGAELNALTQDIVDVTYEVESMNISISALPGTWQKATDAANAYTAAASRASSYKPSSYSPGGGDGSNEHPELFEDVEPTYNGTLKKGDKIEFKPAGGNGTTVATWNTSGISNGSITDNWGYDANYKAGDIKFINGEWMVDIGGGQYVPIYHFQKQGTWGWGTHYYASGGMVDYTGPAWVDGNKTHPEAFLSAYQTEQIGALANALDTNTVNNVSGDSNVTFGSINFNVASMSSSADGKKALEVFVQGANDLMAKRGIGTTLNMNVK